MKRPRICATIVNNDLDAIKGVEPLVDLFEVRIDIIGNGWQELAGKINKPWIACNRSADEGGGWQGSEAKRREELLIALELGAGIIDIELMTGNLEEIVKRIKQRAKCLLSWHDFEGTPSLDRMQQMVQKQLVAGADICKVVTTARKFEDNLAVLQLIPDFSEARVISFAMGLLGFTSRILCPLVGGDFVYASIEKGKEAAPGQITVEDLRKIYGLVENGS
ncbi:type I 3-dehydroquinate dehydratase [Chloroflexota bacterium]